MLFLSFLIQFYQIIINNLIITLNIDAHILCCIRGREVDGNGLIIRLPLEHHWFKSSRMHF